MKCLMYAIIISPYLSHPSRGAWIEILRTAGTRHYLTVAPLTGCVD